MARNIPKPTGLSLRDLVASAISCRISTGVLDPSISDVEDALDVLSNMFDPTYFAVTPGLVQLHGEAARVLALSVNNINDPSPELHVREGLKDGEILLAYQTSPGWNEFTMYGWDGTSSLTEDIPYVVRGPIGTGFWIALGGKYIFSDIYAKSTLFTETVRCTNLVVDSTADINYSIIDQASITSKLMVGTTSSVGMFDVTLANAGEPFIIGDGVLGSFSEATVGAQNRISCAGHGLTPSQGDLLIITSSTNNNEGIYYVDSYTSAVITIDGNFLTAGDTDADFTIISNGMAFATPAVSGDGDQYFVCSNLKYRSTFMEYGTDDIYSRPQLHLKVTDSIIRVGSFQGDGDGIGNNQSSEGIIVYGQNAQGDTFDEDNYGYFRIKPDRVGIYNKKNGVYGGYIFRIDASSNDFYAKDNTGNITFDFDRSNGNLDIAGNLDVDDVKLRKTGTATAGTQYPSYDVELTCSVWDETNTQAEDRHMYWTLNAGSGAHGSEPYFLSLYDNNDTEILRIDPTNPIAPAIHFSGYIYNKDDPNTGIYLRTDRITLYSGGRTMIDAVETSQDILYLGHSGSDDIDISIGPNGCLFVEGSSGNITVSSLEASKLVATNASKELISFDTTSIVHNDLSGRDAAACHPASSIETDHLSTYTTIQDYINTTQTAGLLTGGITTDNGDGTIRVEGGTGFLKVSNSITAQTVFFDWSDSTSVVLFNNSLNYIFIDYNGGSPIVSVSTTCTNENLKTKFPISRVYRTGTEIRILQGGILAHSIPELLQYQQFEVYGTYRASGLITTEVGERYIYITPGVFYCALNRIVTPIFDSTGSDTFGYWYRDGGSGWTRVTGQSQIDNVHYDNGTGTLAELTVNRYGVHWVFEDAQGNVEVIYGQGNYNLTDAQNAQPPSSTPPILHSMSIFVAKIIIQKNDTDFTSIETPYGIPFVTTIPSNHNDLGSIQGGAGGEYFHQTSAQASLYTVNGLVYPQDSGVLTIIDMLISASPGAGTEESYAFKIDNTTIFKVYTEADGSGGIQNNRIESNGRFCFTEQGNAFGRGVNADLVDDGYIDLDSTSNGFILVSFNNGNDYGFFHFENDGSIHDISKSANVDTADTDNKFCVFDNGSNVRIKNRRGSTYNVMFWTLYGF